MWQLLSCIPIDRYITAAVPLLDLRPSSEFSGKVSKFLRSLADFLLALAFFVAITQYQPPSPSAVGGGGSIIRLFQKTRRRIYAYLKKMLETISRSKKV